MSDKVDLGSASRVPAGEARCFEIRGRRIAVFHLADGEFKAIDDECSHAKASLAAGTVEDGCVSCPWHGARFDLASGAALSPPAVEKVRAYEVVEEDAHLILLWVD